MPKICKAEGCRKRCFGHGYCQKHWYRWKYNGSPNKVKINIHKNKVKNTPTYNSWVTMKNRCYCESATSYKYYGGRGVEVCERWRGVYGFDNFVKDMGTRPSGCTLDRIDPNGNYCPENCRWANIYVQTANRKIKKQGGSKTIGVFYRKDKKIWAASLTVDKIEHRRYFQTEEEAISYRHFLESIYLD